MLAVFIHREDLDRNMTRGWILLQVIEDGPAEHVGKKDIE